MCEKISRKDIMSLVGRKIQVAADTVWTFK